MCEPQYSFLAIVNLQTVNYVILRKVFLFNTFRLKIYELERKKGTEKSQQSKHFIYRNHRSIFDLCEENEFVTLSRSYLRSLKCP